MSNLENEVFIEALYNRLVTVIDNGASTYTAQRFDDMIAEGNIEEAREFIETLEAVYADDLI